MTSPESNDEEALEQEQPFISHLLELRDRLLRVVASVVVVFACLVYWSNDLYSWLSAPLIKMLPAGGKMIATEVASTFFTPFKFTLMVSIFTAIPYILYQFWKFVAPGLYSHERKMAAPIVVSSVVLFYSGMAFAYYVVFPLVFKFFATTAPAGVAFSPDISKYLDFVLTIFFAFGAAFEVPIATIVLVWLGVTTPAKLRKMRPYIIVAAFMIGAVLTPPDAVSQTLLAIPMWALFELGILFSRFYQPKDADEEDEDDQADDHAESGGPIDDPGPRGGGAPASGAAATSEETGPEDTASEDGPMSEEEMEAELERIDEEMRRLERGAPGEGPGETPDRKPE
jgi:sec-independent protein translocase protein TatC